MREIVNFNLDNTKQLPTKPRNYRGFVGAEGRARTDTTFGVEGF